MTDILIEVLSNSGSTPMNVYDVGTTGIFDSVAYDESLPFHFKLGTNGWIMRFCSLKKGANHTSPGMTLDTAC